MQFSLLSLRHRYWYHYYLFIYVYLTIVINKIDDAIVSSTTLFRTTVL
jgi:hypothetical protein